MRKIIAVVFTMVMLIGSVSGCGSTAASDDDKLNIVTTIFPEYDWVCQILGNETEKADVTMLLENGVDLHNYQPTATDIIKISDCDMFIYVGGESDKWVEDALANAVNEDMIVINLMEVLGERVVEEEIVEGMEHEHEDEESEEEEEHAYVNDEHVWLSLKNAKTICKYIAEQLAAIDEEHAEIYIANVEMYIEKLEKLDAEYAAVAEEASFDTMLFADRFPFRYLVDDYGINYYAAFSGCSAETEASFETIVFLAEKVDELKLNSVMTIDGSDGSIAKTVISNTSVKNQNVLELDSIQSVTSSEIANGVTYLSIMESNLEVLKAALN